MKTQYRQSQPRKTTRPEQQDRLTKHLTPEQKRLRTRAINQILADPMLML